MSIIHLLLLVLIIPMPIAFASTPGVYEITQTSLELALENMLSDDIQNASEHMAFASEFFATNQIHTGSNTELDIQIHMLLMDVDMFISNNDTHRAQKSIDSTLELFDNIEMTPSPNDYTDILAVAEKNYREGIIYENEPSSDIAHRLVLHVAEQNENKKIYALAERMDSKDSEYASVADSIAYVQRTVFGANSVVINDSYLYVTIRSLYDSVLESVERGKYDDADDSAIEAYLDNFEYLESTIAAANEDLMLSLEIEMRDNLRRLLADEASTEKIRMHIDTNILPNLARAEEMTALSSSKSVVESRLAEPGRAMARMGSSSNEQKAMVRAEIDDIREKIRQSVVLHKSGDYESAYASARSAYLDSYELIEIPLRVISPDFTLEVEAEFAEFRNLIRAPASEKDIRAITLKIESSLDESERLVSGTGELAPAIAFSSSFAIIFREGLESVLVLGAILTYLETSRNSRFKPHLMYGVLGGIGATAVTWVVAQYIIDISGANREYIEAIAALSATAVLFYVSFWVLNKIEHKKWMEFVKAKVWQATTTGSATVFVMLSFFTIYREGFETVLFYQAMISYAKYSELYVILGFVLGLGVLFLIYYVMRRLGRRLPLRILFGLTMGVGAYLSIAFLGNAIRQLQLLDILPYTSMLGTLPRLDVNIATLTGIYPTLETTIGQIVLLSIYLTASSYVLILRPRRIMRLAAMHKSRSNA